MSPLQSRGRRLQKWGYTVCNWRVIEDVTRQTHMMWQNRYTRFNLMIIQDVVEYLLQKSSVVGAQMETIWDRATCGRWLILNENSVGTAAGKVGKARILKSEIGYRPHSFFSVDPVGLCGNWSLKCWNILCTALIWPLRITACLVHWETL